MTAPAIGSMHRLHTTHHEAIDVEVLGVRHLHGGPYGKVVQLRPPRRIAHPLGLPLWEMYLESFERAKKP